MATNPLHSLWKGWQRGPMIAKSGGTNPFANRTTLNSGSASVVVSTALVSSNSLIMFGTQPSSVGVGANSGGAIVVNSIVSGTSFAFARATGTAVPWNEVIMWSLIKTS